jgi:hypothetical protein
MPIIFQSGLTPTVSTTKVSDIEACTSQDVRQVLNPLVGATQPVDNALLIDYTNRISLQMLRFSRWKFLESAPQLFVTQPGVTDYWIGPLGGAPVGAVDTGLNIGNIQSIKKDFVYNRSAYYPLFQTANPPLTKTLQLDQKPRFWRNDPTTPGVLNVYPPSDSNAQQPDVTPGGAIVVFTPGGALPQRTYFVTMSFVDSAGGESLASLEASFVVPAGMLATVKSPILEIAGASGVLSVTTASGVVINSWNCYMSAGSGVESLQNLAPIQIGTDFTEPVTGLTTTGQQNLGTNTIALLGGYVIEFRYFLARTALTTTTQLLQIPDDYKDIVCAGVNWLAYKYLKKDDEATVWSGVYQHGLTEMIRDRNLFPRDGEFIHGDPLSQHTSINTGVGLDSGMETSIP